MNYITSSEQARNYIDQLIRNKVEEIAIDIEGDYNLHEYGEKLCLIQIYDGSNRIIIDPFSLDDETISLIFGHPGIGRIMYDASSDQALIFKKYNIRIKSIYDLKPAADLLDLPRKDLSSVLEMFLGVPKNRNYQKYNWTRRPIEEGALEYALNDVIYLFDLKDKLFGALEESGLTGEYLRINKNINTRKIDVDREPGFFRKALFLNLKHRERERVRKIFYIRDAYAKSYNVPPHHIFSNENIVNLGTGRLSFNNVKLYGRLGTGDRADMHDEIKKVLEDR